jgi:hypothetical protein
LLATKAQVRASIAADDASADIDGLLRRAQAVSTVSN